MSRRLRLWHEGFDPVVVCAEDGADFEGLFEVRGVARRSIVFVDRQHVRAVSGWLGGSGRVWQGVEAAGGVLFDRGGVRCQVRWVCRREWRW